MHTAEQPEPGPAVTQQPPSSGGLATRGALQSRAQNLQDGNLTELLMAWFDAGYQTGKHEAQSQHKLHTYVEHDQRAAIQKV